eukprot:7299386-Prymnesium_polylepis.2
MSPSLIDQRPSQIRLLPLRRRVQGARAIGTGACALREERERRSKRRPEGLEGGGMGWTVSRDARGGRAARAAPQHSVTRVGVGSSWGRGLWRSPDGDPFYDGPIGADPPPEAANVVPAEHEHHRELKQPQVCALPTPRASRGAHTT